VVVAPHAPRPMRAGLKHSKNGGARLSFQLFDTRKRFDIPRSCGAGPKLEPRIHVFGASPFVPMFRPPEPSRAEAESDDGMVDAARLGGRLAAVKLALEDLPRQVQRLARWQARRDRMANTKFQSPLRPGKPPGHRDEGQDDVHRVLSECHALARDALKNDSS
jgi:hypothetical protein